MSDQQFNDLYNLIKNPTKTLVAANPIISGNINYNISETEYNSSKTILTHNEQANVLLKDKEKLMG